MLRGLLCLPFRYVMFILFNNRNDLDKFRGEFPKVQISRFLFYPIITTFPDCKL